jgi:hypothetical protein
MMHGVYESPVTERSSSGLHENIWALWLFWIERSEMPRENVLEQKRSSRKTVRLARDERRWRHIERKVSE